MIFDYFIVGRIDRSIADFEVFTTFHLMPALGTLRDSYYLIRIDPKPPLLRNRERR